MNNSIAIIKMLRRMKMAKFVELFIALYLALLVFKWKFEKEIKTAELISENYILLSLDLLIVCQL